MGAFKLQDSADQTENGLSAMSLPAVIRHTNWRKYCILLLDSEEDFINVNGKYRFAAPGFLKPSMVSKEATREF